MKYTWRIDHHHQAIGLYVFLALLFAVETTSGATDEEVEFTLVSGDSPSQRLERPRRHGSRPVATPRGLTTLCSAQCMGSFGNISMKELKRNYRIDSVQQEILRKLKMPYPPNVTGRIPSIPAMENLMKQLNNDGNTDELDQFTPVTIITLASIVPADGQQVSSSSSSSCYFNFSRELRAEQIISANLGLYVKPRNSLRPGSSIIQATSMLIYRLLRSHSKMLIRSRKIYLTPTHTGKWQNFDVKNLVEFWLRQPANNLGIQVQATDMNGEPLVVLPTSNEDDNVLRPYIEVSIKSNQVVRPRRSFALDCPENSAERKCCRFPLTIDFEDFRWDWVIAPKRYDAFFCSGDCPFLYAHSPPVTHLVQQTMNRGGGGEEGAGTSVGVPCCSPAFMSPLQMLYMDSNSSIVLGNLPGMIVERCGCS